jgi:hypothetical protein
MSKNESVFSGNTLIPVSFVIVMGGFLFSFAGLYFKAENTAIAASELKARVDKAESNAATLNAETITQMNSLAIGVAEIEKNTAVSTAVLNAKMDMIIEMMKKGKQ